MKKKTANRAGLVVVGVGPVVLEELVRAEHEVAHPAHKLVRRLLLAPVAVLEG